MNLVSAMVGLTVIGAAAPAVMNVSLQPIIAQKRANNFAIAESTAVSYAASHEGAESLTLPPPEGCKTEPLRSEAHSVTCSYGDLSYVQTVTRSFRLIPPPSCDDNDGNNGHGNSGGYDCSNPGNSGFVKDLRVFDFPPPPGFTGHQCLITDNWGLDTDAFDREKNKWKGMSCTPNAAWHSAFYLDSDPNAWMYDINKHNGWGEHPDY